MMDIRDEMKRCLTALSQLAAESESKQIKADIDMLMGVALQLTTELANRNAALAKRCQSRKAKSPKSAPVSGPKQPKQPQSSTDTPDAQNDAEDRSKALSSIQQGIRQAEPTMADQQRALRGKVYGTQNDEVAFRKAAQALAR
jgi:hypothetical protein